MPGARVSHHHSYRRVTAIASTIALCGALVIVPGITAMADDPIDTSTLEVMGDYPTAGFVADAAELSPELIASLDSDLGITGEEFLAQAEASTQAVAVVKSLEDAGLEVLGSSIEGTTLTVNVSSEAEVATIEAVGAVAEIGEPEPDVMPDLPLTMMAGGSDFYGGQGYYYQASAGNAFRCTSGFNGFATSSGAPQFLSAGHCVADIASPATALTMATPNDGSPRLGAVLGNKVANSARVGSGYDSGLVSIGNSGVNPKGAVLNWGGSGGAPLSSAPVGVTGVGAVLEGSFICKSGSSTGWACGEVMKVDYDAPVEGKVINSIVTTACTAQGDSGGAALAGTLAIGITSWANTAKCGEPSFRSGLFPMVSVKGLESVSSAYGANWQIALTIPAPIVTSAGIPQPGGSPITGTLARAVSGSTVGLYVDGSATPVTTVPADNGNWSIPMTGVAAGKHIYRVAAGLGYSRSEPVPVGLVVDRISGADRFAVGVGISQKLYPDPATADVVYITTGLNFPDALSAAPAAAVQKGVMLLTLPGSLPSVVRNEIIRLHPKRIVVVGGVNSVSEAVFDDLATLTSRDTSTNAPRIERLGGADRYVASRTIVRSAFQGMASARTVYIATGANFPDALSASAAGGAKGFPVILVNGGANNIDSPTRQLLTDLGVTAIRIAGGPNSVSPGIEADLTAIARDTVRLSGADRFEASSTIAVNAFGSASPREVFLATGLNFPDALSSAVLAGRSNAPLIVVPTDCVPEATIASIVAFNSTNIHLVGGPVSLTANVFALKQC